MGVLGLFFSPKGAKRANNRLDLEGGGGRIGIVDGAGHSFLLSVLAPLLGSGLDFSFYVASLCRGRGAMEGRGRKEEKIRSSRAGLAWRRFLAGSQCNGLASVPRFRRVGRRRAAQELSSACA